MRAVFILLGVVYHAAQPYESHAWIISDPAYSPLLAGIAFALHEFRMPAFFMLSGFLAALACRKYGGRTLLTRRLVRLGVPLLFGLLTIVPLQNALTAWLQHVQCSPGQPCGVRVSHGFAMSHLWFLAYLLLFVAALPATFELLRRVSASSRAMRMRRGYWRSCTPHRGSRRRARPASRASFSVCSCASLSRACSRRSRGAC